LPCKGEVARQDSEAVPKGNRRIGRRVAGREHVELEDREVDRGLQAHDACQRVPVVHRLHIDEVGLAAVSLQQEVAVGDDVPRLTDNHSAS
jgi:hypothetical protein